ncbi:MAG: hypothetical protein CME64_13865 [Halobacteriovoraceae bacterium]|nr:hypothetical protein [Halobacteriovoraceae bacterium]|tara:strand:+ start:19498 stop:20103 length:606 start_codon:yes stop_codon:yes gene_type:complete
MKRTTTYAFAIFWILGVTGFISNLHGVHNVSFKLNEKSVAKSLAYFSKKSAKDTNVVHFLTPSCSCSKVIKEDLLKRTPLSSEIIQEKVVLIDDFDRHFTKALLAKGYNVLNISYESLSTEIPEAVNAVPMLVIHDKKNHLQYAGGYSKNTITPLTKIDIKSLIKKSKSIDHKEYPVRGCAVSKKYQALLDPMGVKYAKAN